MLCVPEALGSKASELSWSLLHSSSSAGAGPAGVVAAGRPATGTSSADSSDSHKRGSMADGSKAEKVCRICDAECEKRSRYCLNHKRSYECIYRQAARDKSSPEYESWVRIFGGKFGSTWHDGQEAVAAAVLIDYTRNFPSGKDSKKRGNIDLTAYTCSEGTRQYRQAVERDQLMDYELFTCQMELLRKWSHEKVGASARTHHQSIAETWLTAKSCHDCLSPCF